MKKALRKLIIGIVLLVIFGISTASLVSAETTISYKVEPAEPTPLSEVKISAELDGDDVTAVYLEMQECTAAGICYSWDTNVSMDSLGNNIYQAKITLEHDDASYFSLRTLIERDGGWEQTTEYKVDLNVEDSSDGNGNGNGSNTPGFEMILLFVAIIVGIILFTRKR